MALSEARTNANKRYHDKFDDIKVRVPKGKRELIQQFAAKHGQSVNFFINQAIDIAMQEKK